MRENSPHYNQSAAQIAPEAERRVLGAILARPELLAEVLPHIGSSEAFTSTGNRRIFQAVMLLDTAGRPVSVTSVSDLLLREGTLAEVGGRAALVDLLEEPAADSQIGPYAKHVGDLYRVRSVFCLADSLLRLRKTPGVEFEYLESLIEKGLMAISGSRNTPLITIKQIISEMSAKLFEGLPIIPCSETIDTGIADLNRLLGGGLFAGEMAVIGGPPSMGKSALALSICHFNAICGNSSLYFALDETHSAIAQRILSLETQLRRDQFVHGRLTDAEKQKIADANTTIQTHRGELYLCDRSDMSIEMLRSIARQQHRKHKLNVIVVDYIGLLKSPPGVNGDNRTLQVSENSRLLKALAKELGVAVIVVSQLSRAYASLPFNPEKKELGLPTQSMLRDSGQIEADANTILFPWRPLEAMRKRGMTEGDAQFDKEVNRNSPPVEDAIIVVAKNKTGPTGQVKAKFNADRMLFYSQYEGLAL